ncbi:MAG: hypothetical protein IJ225_06945 [Solobacterium sp.]|nr:hypothetical protein [Solobacterium sp.]
MKRRNWKNTLLAGLLSLNLCGNAMVLLAEGPEDEPSNSESSDPVSQDKDVPSSLGWNATRSDNGLTIQIYYNAGNDEDTAYISKLRDEILLQSGETYETKSVKKEIDNQESTATLTLALSSEFSGYVYVKADGYYDKRFSFTGEDDNSPSQDIKDVPSSLGWSTSVSDTSVTITIYLITGDADEHSYFDQLLKITSILLMQRETTGINVSPLFDEKDDSVTISFTLPEGYNANADVSIPVSGYWDQYLSLSGSSPGEPQVEETTVPGGTKINGVTTTDYSGLEDFSISCVEGNPACAAYLDTVQNYGTVVLEDSFRDNDISLPTASQSRDTLFSQEVREDGKRYLTISKTNFKEAVSDWNLHALTAHVEAPGYITLYQGDESEAYPPVTGDYACKLSLQNPSTYEYVISCENSPGTLEVLGANTDVQLTLMKGNDDPVILNLGTGYSLDPNNHKLTFTKEQLDNSTASIPEGNYQVRMKITHMYDRNFPGIIQIVTDEDVYFPNVNYAPFPEGVEVKAVEMGPSGTGMIVTCNAGEACSAFLNKMYDDSKLGLQTGGTSFFNTQSGLELYRRGEGIPGPYYFGYQEDTFSKVVQDGLTTALEIKPSFLVGMGIPSGAVFDDGQVGVLGYGVRPLEQFMEEPARTVVITNGATLIEDVVLSQNENTELTVTSSDREFLESITDVGLQSSTGPSGGTTVTKDYRTIEENEDGTYTLTISLKDLFWVYAWTQSGDKPITVTLTGGSYYYMGSMVLNHDMERMPTDVRISVIGDGLKISNTQAVDIDFLKEVAEGKDKPVLGEFNTRVNFNEAEEVPDQPEFYVSRSKYPYRYDASTNSVIVDVDWEQLEELGAKKDADYLFQLYDSHYGISGQQRFGLSLNPILLTYYAEHPKTYTPEELEAMNELAVTNGEEGLQNVTVKEEETGDANVDIYGAVAGAITTDNEGGADNSDLNYDDKEVEITVQTDATVLEDDRANEVVDRFGHRGYEPTDVCFDIMIYKTYNEKSGKPGTHNIRELPYEAALIFDLPSTPLKPGHSYHLLREHNGRVEEIPFQIIVIGGVRKGLTYTSKFSSFVLATEDEEAAPAPTEMPKVTPSSTSSKSSSKGTSAVVSDSVITCQMAGYPSNYAWNEAAKACQPGFVDNAGAFHSTRLTSPRTSDEGLGTPLIHLIVAMVIAAGAGYQLRRNR